MKYRDREQLEDAVKTILQCSESALEELSDDHIKQEIRKVRRMDDV